MNKRHLLYWKNKYDKEQDLQNRKVEEILRGKFRKNQFFAKSDLTTIVKWKFKELPGRQKRTLALLKGVDKSLIKEISKLTFSTRNDEIRLALLCHIKGVGNALSSVILAFYDPQNYGIFDIHVWRGLFGKEPRNIWSNKKHVIRFLKKLREISNRTGLSCREVEKAFFQKDFERSQAEY